MSGRWRALRPRIAFPSSSRLPAGSTGDEAPPQNQRGAVAQAHHVRSGRIGTSPVVVAARASDPERRRSSAEERGGADRRAVVKRIEQVLRSADRFQQRHGALGFPIGVIKKFVDDEAGKHAALLAYYGFVSLFPLLLIFVTVLGYTLANNPDLQEELIDTVIARFPGFGPQLQGSIRSIEGSGIGLAIGILGTLWGGLGITRSAQDAMNAIWNIPRRDRPTWWLRLVRSLGSLMLVVFAVFAATALARLGTVGHGVVGRLPLAGSLVLNLLLLTALSQVLTAVRQPWRRLLPGAAVGAIGWSTLQALGSYIVSRQLERANLVYGAFAVVIVLLSWLYLTAELLLFATEVNVVLARRLWPRSLTQSPLTGPDEQVLAALALTEERLPEQTIEVRFSAGESGDDPPGPGGQHAQGG
jgi:YihY family inner membrane protein